jgi:excisionase family DNA binding protein
MNARTTPPKRTQNAFPSLGTKVRYTLPEASHLLGISMSLLYERIAAGQIQAARDGRRRFVTDAELRRYGEQSH